MKTNRRKFIKSAALSGGASAILPLSSCSPNVQIGTDYSVLDEVLKKPVLKRELFPDPVIIETLELLRDRNNTICRVRSKDGALGVAIGHPFIARSSYPMFNINLKRHFLGKDARDLDLLIYNAAERNVKTQGIPLCVQIAVIEFAILDMLGNIAKKPAGQLIGEIRNPGVSFYLGHHLWELRNLEPEESLELVYQHHFCPLFLLNEQQAIYENRDRST